ncbi:MAG: hypothetical protein K1X94_14725 [Sandaracinaceae bacterium]|nr:hypothetical protein [Sandaracinaceae bacterium]
MSGIALAILAGAAFLVALAAGAHGVRARLDMRRGALVKLARTRRGRFLDAGTQRLGPSEGHRVIVRQDGVPVLLEIVARDGDVLVRASARFVMGRGPVGTAAPPLLESALLEPSVWGVDAVRSLGARVLTRYAWTGDDAALRAPMREALENVTDAVLRVPTFRFDGESVEITHPYGEAMHEDLGPIAEPMITAAASLARMGLPRARSVAASLGAELLLLDQDLDAVVPGVRMGRVLFRFSFVGEPPRVRVVAAVHYPAASDFAGEQTARGMSPPLPSSVVDATALPMLASAGSARLRITAGRGAELEWSDGPDAARLRAGAHFLEGLAAPLSRGAFR